LHSQHFGDLSIMPVFRRCAVLLSLIFTTAAVAQNPPKPPDPHQQIADQLSAIGQFTSAWRFHEADVPHGEVVNLDDSSWKSIDPTPQWEGHKWNGGSAWFRTLIEVPKTNKGYDLTGANIWVNQETDDDIIVYVNGLRIAMGESLEP